MTQKTQQPLQKRSSSWKKQGLKMSVLVVVALLLVLINEMGLQNSVLASYANRFGYIGLFFLSAISGFNIIFPVPIIALYPSLIGFGFHPAITIGVISLGMLVGDGIGYMIGYTSRSIIDDHSRRHRWLTRIHSLAEKHPLLPIFFLTCYAAFVPLPNELIVIPMAFMGYRWWQMMLALLIGNILFNILFALGITSLSALFSYG